MPIFSGPRNIPLAAVDIVIVWATIIWLAFAIGPIYKWVTLAQVRLGVDCHSDSVVDHLDEQKNSLRLQEE